MLTVKFSARFYGLLAILGIIFLALVLAGAYLDGADSLSILVLLSPMSPKVGLWFVLGGIAFLTGGMVGIIRQYFRNHRKLFTALAVLLIPPLTFGTIVVGSVNAFFSALSMDPLRSEITQVTVVDANPLVLSVDVIAITSKNTWIESAVILNSNGSKVAQIPSEEVWKAEAVYGYFTLTKLPGGSEISLTLDFNTTLPSGDYLVKLTCWHNSHGSSPFTIP
jgi:hypothetical protein